MLASGTANSLQRSPLAETGGRHRVHPDLRQHDDTVGHTAGATTTPGAAEIATLTLPPRYTQRGALGSGGFGQVVLVFDNHLQREVALKVLRPALRTDAAVVAQFLQEARFTAQLEHAGIVPIYDLGWLPDGAMYYTVKRIQGQTLSEVITQTHSQLTQATADPDALLQTLVGHLYRVSVAVAFAHSRGLVHRDLKPGNVMVGAFGEVLVLDWGLARVVGAPLDERSAGTPRFAAPELAAGPSRVAPTADVFSLGVMLVVSLAGFAAPPPELVRICARARAAAPADRHADAAQLAADLQGWMTGAHRRTEAAELLQRAEQQQAQATLARLQAETARHHGRLLLAGLPTHAEVLAKRRGWAAQDQADGLAQQAALLGMDAEQLLNRALQLVPDLPQAHRYLADLARQRLHDAEHHRDRRGTQAAMALLRAHDDGSHSAYLAGTGALTLHTTPCAAEALLYRYVSRDRRLHPELVRSLGPTPLLTVPLEMGSWLLELRTADRPSVWYPVCIARQQHWDGVRPGGTAPQPITLPDALGLGEGQCYVPAGWFRAGDADGGLKCLVDQRVWLDGFVVQRFAVTNAAYAEFLNDLWATGQEALALQCAPRERPGTSERGGAIIFGRDGDGRFFPTYDADGDLWLPDYPVTMVPWPAACAYAQWYSAKTGQRWQLPWELQWEKAARGVDGRPWPWGEFLDPTWTTMYGSSAGRVGPSVVGSCPTDVSPYGVRGMAGNTRDWCLDAFTSAGVSCDGEVFDTTAAPPATEVPRVLKGGGFYSAADACRASSRQDNLQTARTADLGFRLVRQWPEEPRP